jgi:hypothetical protein
VIDDAVATGEWTDENVHALDAQFSAMPADARVAAGQRHAVAVNAGTIHVHFLGPLL